MVSLHLDCGCVILGQQLSQRYKLQLMNDA